MRGETRGGEEKFGKGESRQREEREGVMSREEEGRGGQRLVR